MSFKEMSVTPGSSISGEAAFVRASTFVDRQECASLDSSRVPFDCLGDNADVAGGEQILVRICTTLGPSTAPRRGLLRSRGRS